MQWIYRGGRCIPCYVIPFYHLSIPLSLEHGRSCLVGGSISSLLIFSHYLSSFNKVRKQEYFIPCSCETLWIINCNLISKVMQLTLALSYVMYYLQYFKKILPKYRLWGNLDRVSSNMPWRNHIMLSKFTISCHIHEEKSTLQC